MSKKLAFALGCFVFVLAFCQEKATQVAQKTPLFTSDYSEKHRPQFHFSPPARWMNDPNGMFFYEGEWHLFYQFYPDSTVWGPMHWGHAVSRDLVFWENLPIALFPDSSLYVFSGSAAVDWANSSGFSKNGKPPIVALFTIHDMKKEAAKREDVESQGLAFSNDAGRTWTKYAQNPVISNPMRGKDRDFRDPKIVWHEASKNWICALAVGDHAEFWGSPDLKKWTFQSAFGQGLGPKGTWECPDFAPIRVEKSDETKWALIQNLNPGGPNGGSGAQFFIGDFDGKTFTPDAKTPVPGWLDFGKDNYASVSFSDIPASDGRRILIGWMSNWQYAQVVPTDVWRSAMTLPREIFLRKKADGGYFLISKPVAELEKLRQKTVALEAQNVVGKMDLTEKMGASAGLFELELEFELPVEKTKTSFGIELSNLKNECYRIGFDASKNQFFSDRRRAGDASFSKDFADKISVAPRFSDSKFDYKTVKMHVFFDAASAELFADDGLVSMTEIFFPTEPFSKISLFSEGKNGRLLNGRAHVLRSIWR